MLSAAGFGAVFRRALMLLGVVPMEVEPWIGVEVPWIGPGRPVKITSLVTSSREPWLSITVSLTW